MATEIYERGRITGTAFAGQCEACGVSSNVIKQRMIQVTVTLDDTNRQDRYGHFSYIKLCRLCLADLLTAISKD